MLFCGLENFEKVIKMGEMLWKQELALAISESGLPWTVFAAGCAQDSSTCFAHVDNTQTRESKRVKLSTDKFFTPEARKAEIIRQLSN